MITLSGGVDASGGYFQKCVGSEAMDYIGCLAGYVFIVLAVVNEYHYWAHL